MIRDPEEIKKRVTGNIGKLNERLLLVSLKLDRVARNHKFARTPPGQIITSFFRKAVNSFRAIQLLKKHRMQEESWILLRVLLEAHVNLLYFLRHDPREMTMRYVDASILDKLKHLREVDFYKGTMMEGNVDRHGWEKTEARIKARYPSAVLSAMRRNGFTGIPFDQRSRVVGLKTMYEYCYRISSRSIHSFDPAETSVFASAFRGRGREKMDFLRYRKLSLDSTQHMLMGRASMIISELVGGELGLELMLIGLGYEKFRDKTNGLTPDKGRPLSEEKTPPGTFYIFRE